MNRPFGLRQAIIKPENAIQRAEELLAVNLPYEALNALHEILNMRRARSVPPSSLEPLVMKYLSLAVTLRRYRQAREVLYFYKNLAQSTSVTSVDKVVRHFLDCSEARLDAVLDQAPEASTIDDLESLETFDSLFSNMLNSLEDNDETTNCESDKASLQTTTTTARDWDGFTSRLRFLWEAYRTALDLLRNNAKLEILYQHVATKAFDFCLRHKRKNEFRRLCETLRGHLNAIRRTGSIHFSINIGDPEILQRFLETRFVQLQTATDLDLWQESFRSAEDIYELLIFAAEKICLLNNIDQSQLTDLLPTALLNNKQHGVKMMQMLVQYYEKLTRVFAVSEDSFFLAAAWNKYYSWTANMKGDNESSPQQKLTIANNVVLSALAAPVHSDSPVTRTTLSATAAAAAAIATAAAAAVVTAAGSSDFPSRFNRKERLTKMLGWARAPDRASLLSEAVTKLALTKAESVVRELFSVLEISFHPLTAARQVGRILAHLTDIFPEFAKYADAIRKVTIVKILREISTFYSVIPFATLLDLTNVSTTGGACLQLFDLEKIVVQGNKSKEFSIIINHAQKTFEFRINTIDVDFFKILQAPLLSAARIAETDNAFLFARLQMQDEHWQNLGRQDTIEEIKVKNEEERITKFVKEPLEDMSKRTREAGEALKARVEADKLASKAQKLEREQLAMRKLDACKEANMLRVKYGFLISDEDLEFLDAEAVDNLYKRHMMQERQGIENRMKDYASKADYIERALREAEIPLVLVNRKQVIAQGIKQAVVKRKRAIEESKEQHELDLQLMSRVQRMQSQANAYLERYADRFRDEIDRNVVQMSKQLADAKRERRHEVICKMRERIHAIEEADRLRREQEAEEELRHVQEQQQARLLEEEADAERRRMKAYLEPALGDFDQGDQRPRASDTDSNWRRAGEPSQAFGGGYSRGGGDSGPVAEQRAVDEVKNWRVSSSSSESLSQKQPLQVERPEIADPWRRSGSGLVPEVPAIVRIPVQEQAPDSETQIWRPKKEPVAVPVYAAPTPVEKDERRTSRPEPQIARRPPRTALFSEITVGSARAPDFQSWTRAGGAAAAPQQPQQPADSNIWRPKVAGIPVEPQTLERPNRERRYASGRSGETTEPRGMRRPSAGSTSAPRTQQYSAVEEASPWRKASGSNPAKRAVDETSSSLQLSRMFGQSQRSFNNSGNSTSSTTSSSRNNNQ